jgi:hypothetical protein
VARSGAPFNIVTGADLNGDSLYTDRPAFASNPQLIGMIATRRGVFNTQPGPGDVIIPRNYGEGPGYFTLNFRVSRTFGFGELTEGAGHPSGVKRGGAVQSAEGGLHNILRDGSTGHRYNLTLSLQVRNILNHTNPGMPVGTLGSPLLGQSTWLASSYGPEAMAAGDNRRVQIQLRFTF